MSLDIQELTLYSTPGPTPQAPPTAVTVIGVFNGTLGRGLTRADLNPAAGTGMFEFFNRHGSIRGTAAFTDTLGPAGITVAGTSTVTGGTGTYAHATGTLEIVGSVNPRTDHGSIHQAGTLTY